MLNRLDVIVTTVFIVVMIVFGEEMKEDIYPYKIMTTFENKNNFCFLTSEYKVFF